MASFGTVFKQRTPIYKSIHEKLTTRAARQLHRRLVLPIAENNWLRAVEVVQSKFTRRGVRPEHWQGVVDHVARSTVEHTRTLDLVREKLVAREIGWSPALLKSLVAAYCSRGRLDGAREVVAFAAKFVEGLPDTHRSRVELELRRRTAKKLGRGVVTAVGGAGLRRIGSATASDADDDAAATVRRRLHRAHKSLGDEGYPLPRSDVSISFSALADLVDIIAKSTSTGRETRKAAVLPPLVELDIVEECIDTLRSCCDVMMPAGGPQAEDARRRLNCLVNDRGVVASLGDLYARSGNWSGALAVLARAASPLLPAVGGDLKGDATSSIEKLFRGSSAATVAPAHGTAPGSAGNVTIESLSPAARAQLGIQAGFAGQWEVALRCLELAEGEGVAGELLAPLLRASLNALGAAGKWVDAMALFDAKKMIGASDPVAHELLFMALATGGADPQIIIGLFDEFSATLDEFDVSPPVGNVTARALLQQQHKQDWERALHVVSSFADRSLGSSKAAGKLSDGERNTVALVYHLHSCSAESKLFTLMRFPYLFPKEVFEGLPTPQAIQRDPAAALEILRNKSEKRRAAVHTAFAPGNGDDFANLPVAEQSAVAVRPARHKYFAPKRVFDPDYVAVEVHATSSSSGATSSSTAAGNPQRDPRPAPLDYNDTASGWSFYGAFGGIKIYEGSRKVPNPLSSWPKQMKSLRNPYRSWDPKLNSSLAHRETVKRWKPNRPL